MFTKKKQYRAGIIPYVVEDNSIKMMFMKPSEKKFGGKEWQIAKGKMEEGETPLETALREGKEELGLFQGNIIDINDLGLFLGRTHVFIANIRDVELFGDPHFETEEIAWLTPDEFSKDGRDIHKPVVKAAVREIERRKI